MPLHFSKMHGAGNDFILVDDRSSILNPDPEHIAALCHRHFGIGADGLMLLRPASGENTDATMVYFNSDGSRAEMCGNGARCFAAFAFRHGVGRPDQLIFQSDAGLIRAARVGHEYEITLTEPKDLVMDQRIQWETQELVIHSINTGVPHAIRIVSAVGDRDILTEGSGIRYHPAFAPRGTNVNFVEIPEVPSDPVLVRTYERGVENETLACGTGVTASAIIAHLVAGCPTPVRCRVAGGDILTVNFRTDASGIHDVTLRGPARFVYEGILPDSL